MKRTYHTTITSILMCLAIFLLFSCSRNANASTTITGEVVDENGDPVVDLSVAVRSHKGDFIPDRHEMRGPQPDIFHHPQQSKTDGAGTFVFKDIIVPSVNLLTLFPKYNSDYEIRGIEIQGVVFSVHPHHFFMFEGFPFGIQEEVGKVDVKLTVRQRMFIRGQVLKADGTPLRNKRVRLKTKTRYVDGGSGSGSGSTRTDNEGRFTEHVENAAYYTLTIVYQGQSVQSQEYLLEEGQQLDGLTFTLAAVKQESSKLNVVDLFTPKSRVRKPAPNRELRRKIVQQRQEGVWAINPANRHAYKVISCKTPKEALTKAAAQKAHLVAINDKEEQQWLLDVYGEGENYWIGYTDRLKQDNKKWDNGDPMTYTNWDTQKLLTTRDTDAGKTYTALIGVTGKWQQISEGTPVADITRKAILEKKDLMIKKAPSEEQTE